jgi:hypothetical protein
MSFAELLDAHLGCTPVPPAAPHVWHSRPVTPPLLSLELPLTASRRTAVEPLRPAPPARLTALDRQTLDEARTPDALRRAYKQLARRYHPDSHPGCTAAEHARLSRLFTEATEHYRVLSGSRL